MFAEAIESILTHHCTPEQVRAVERGASAHPLSEAVAQAGFHELLTPEEQGGGGASWADFYSIVVLCGAHAVPLPLAQTLAARAMVADPTALPSGPITFAPALLEQPNGSLYAMNVPAARVAGHVLAASGEALLLLPVAQADQVPSGVHGSLAASLRWDVSAGRRLDGKLSPASLQPLGALLHAAMMAGAMKQCFDLTMGYANERVQFGKSIGKFQAIQHQLSVMAEHVAAAQMAAEAAFGSGDGLPTLQACAVAKARTSEAAQLVASIAHAVHGAIGVTEEYNLQLHTRHLHEWRVAHGSEAYWHRLLGMMFVAAREPLATDFVRSLC